MKYSKGVATIGLHIIVLMVAVAGVSAYTYVLFQENSQQKVTIESQNFTILSQSAELVDKANEIDTLNEHVSDLKDTIKSKDSTINTLGEKLGLAQSELESLRPVTKSYFAAAVKEDDTGILIPIEVKVVKGTGLVSVNIKNVDLLSGTQESIRTAVDVASDYTGIDVSDKDVDVSFVNEINEIVTLDGPSAGAVITTTIIAALQNKTIDSSVLMTGTIEPDGSINGVGGVLAKAQAAKSKGATKFLVPVGQSVSLDGILVVEVPTISSAVANILK